MNIHFLYPSYPFDSNTIDSSYENELSACIENGFTYSFIDTEQLNNNRLDVSKKHPITEGALIIYRGWMLNDIQYNTLMKLEDKGYRFCTSKEQYFYSHYIVNWYSSISEFTMPTLFCSISDIVDTMKEHNMNNAFVKDYVKSLTTKEGSIAQSPDEAVRIARAIETYRGFIDGGIALRKIVKLQDELENRYFVINGEVFSHNNVIPDIAIEIAGKHSAPFYTIDIGKTLDGNDILIEIGDGQVSDIKQWNANLLYSKIKQAFSFKHQIRSKII